MSTIRSSITALPYPHGEIIRPPAQEVLLSVGKRNLQVAVMRRHPEGFTRRWGAFFRDCWRRMSIMHASFEQAESGDGSRSRERSAERLREEEAWSRMDNEGCPNGSQQLDRRPDYIRKGGEVASDR